MINSPPLPCIEINITQHVVHGMTRHVVFGCRCPRSPHIRHFSIVECGCATFECQSTSMPLRQNNVPRVITSEDSPLDVRIPPQSLDVLPTDFASSSLTTLAVPTAAVSLPSTRIQRHDEPRHVVHSESGGDSMILSTL